MKLVEWVIYLILIFGLLILISLGLVDIAIDALKKPNFFIAPEYESNKEMKLNDPIWNIEQMPYIEPKIRGKRHE